MPDTGIQDLLSTMEYIDTKRQQKKDEAFGVETDAHLEAFQQLGEDYEPEGDYDAKAFATAEISHYSSLIHKGEAAKMVHETRKRDIEASYQSVRDNANKAYGIEALITETTDQDERYGLETQALKYYERAYESFADGSDMVIDDKTLIFHNMDGSTMTKTFESRKEMLETMKQMVENVSDKTAFAQMAMSSRNDIAMHNAKQMSNPTVLRNKEGKRVHRITNVLDPNTGKPSNKEFGDGGYRTTDGVFYRGPQGRMMTRDQVMDGGYLTLDDSKTIAEIEKLEAATKAEGRKGTAAGTSPEEKFAQGLARIYGIDQQTAMDYILKSKIDKAKLDIISGMISEDGYGDEDVQKHIKDLGLESMVDGRPMSEVLQEIQAAKKKKGGKGLPTTTKKKPTKEQMVSFKKEFRNLEFEHGKANASQMMSELHPNVDFGA